jgi:IMP dehydrogenase
MIKFTDGLCFDDVLLVPKYSEIRSRSEVNLSVKLSKGIEFKLPYIPANMTDVIGKEMIMKMIANGCLSLMHRFCPVDEQLALLQELCKVYGAETTFKYVGVSVGVKKIDYGNVATFIKAGVKIICIDIAHLDSELGINMVRYIHVATADAAQRVWAAGADVVKVGIGASGVCSTRLEAGAGVPQLTAIAEVAERRKLIESKLGRELFFISDGGHKITADVVKSLCFADMVMLGGLMAGTPESPGTNINVNGVMYKSYSGSSTHKSERIEGVKAMVKMKPPIDIVIKKLSEGVQSGCSYQNCRNLTELKVDPRFVKMTSAGISESKIHSVTLQG